MSTPLSVPINPIVLRTSSLVPNANLPESPPMSPILPIGGSLNSTISTNRAFLTASVSPVPPSSFNPTISTNRAFLTASVSPVNPSSPVSPVYTSGAVSKGEVGLEFEDAGSADLDTSLILPSADQVARAEMISSCQNECTAFNELVKSLTTKFDVLKIYNKILAIASLGKEFKNIVVSKMTDKKSEINCEESNSFSFNGTVIVSPG